MTRPGQWRGERLTQLWDNLPASDDRVRRGGSQFFCSRVWRCHASFEQRQHCLCPMRLHVCQRVSALAGGSGQVTGFGDGDRWTARRRARP